MGDSNRFFIFSCVNLFYGIIIPMEMTKYCPRCHTRKTGAEFYKSKTTSDGLSGYCKECVKKTARAYVLAHPEKVKKYRNNAKGKYVEKRRELAREYRQRPEVIAKRKEREASKEYKQKAHEYYLKNRERIISYAKKYREDNLDKVKETQRKYRESHADELRAKKTEYARTSPVAKAQRARYKKRRLERDPVFATKERMRKFLVDSFLRRGYKKNSHSEEIIGCDWQTLMNHLFETWRQRYGTVYAGEDYHIDHIIPLSEAKTEDEVIKLCHYTNLQLLKPSDNLSKSNKIEL